MIREIISILGQFSENNSSSLIIVILMSITYIIVKIIENKKHNSPQWKNELETLIKDLSDKTETMIIKTERLFQKSDISQYITEATNDAMCYISNDVIKEFLNVKAKSLTSFITDLICQDGSKLKPEDVDNLFHIYINKFNKQASELVSKDFAQLFWTNHRPRTEIYIETLKEIINDDLRNSKKRRLSTETMKYFETAIKYIIETYHQMLEQGLELERRKNVT